MTQQNHNALWRDFPKTATEFEARFATEADCRAYWIGARWGSNPPAESAPGAVNRHVTVASSDIHRSSLAGRYAEYPDFGRIGQARLDGLLRAGWC
jgi:hypothetical protein